MLWALINDNGDIRALYSEQPSGPKHIENETSRKAVAMRDNDPRVLAWEKQTNGDTA